MEHKSYKIDIFYEFFPEKSKATFKYNIDSDKLTQEEFMFASAHIIDYFNKKAKERGIDLGIPILADFFEIKLEERKWNTKR